MPYFPGAITACGSSARLSPCTASRNDGISRPACSPCQSSRMTFAEDRALRYELHRAGHGCPARSYLRPFFGAYVTFTVIDCWFQLPIASFAKAVSVAVGDW